MEIFESALATLAGYAIARILISIGAATIVIDRVRRVFSHGDDDLSTD